MTGSAGNLGVEKMDKKILSDSFALDGKIVDIQRRAYLSSKGLKEGGKNQLDLFESVAKRSDLRHLPNDYARSSLFTVRNKREPRKTLTHEKLFHYNEYVTILYTGIELRAEDDEIIWMQILNYGKSVPMGEPFVLTIKNLVKDVGWSKSGRNYDRARECISRLRANEILALNAKAYGISGSISLIQNYTAVNDELGSPTGYRVWIDPNLILLFAGNTFTSHRWGSYAKLSPVARRLADYAGSHKQPYPLTLERFRHLCGSTNTNNTSWRQSVKKACDELMSHDIVKIAFLSADDKVCCEP